MHELIGMLFGIIIIISGILPLTIMRKDFNSDSKILNANPLDQIAHLAFFLPILIGNTLLVYFLYKLAKDVEGYPLSSHDSRAVGYFISNFIETNVNLLQQKSVLEHAWIGIIALSILFTALIYLFDQRKWSK